MKTKKLTEAAMLSSLFVITSIIAISTGIMYSIYLDMVVPIFISILFLKIGFKYTTFSSITSLIIVSFVIGDVGSSIWMSQGIILGLVSGAFIVKKRAVLDDILWISVLGCFIVVMVDVYFATLTGYSLIKEFNSVATMFSLGEDMLKLTFYVFVATIPVGTVVLVYIATLFLGNRLNILNKICKEKYIIIKNFKSLGNYLCCSKVTYIINVVYLLIIEVINKSGINIKSAYIITVLMSIRVIVLYFVIKDSYGFIGKCIYLKSKSKFITQVISFAILYFLLIDFHTTTIMLIIVGTIVNILLKLREAQFRVIDNYIS